MHMRLLVALCAAVPNVQDSMQDVANSTSAETVSISPDGVLYMPDNLGRIWTSSEGGAGPLRQLTYTGGKPLGGYVYPSGDAIFCDALKVPTARCT